MLHIFIDSLCILALFWKKVPLEVKTDCQNKLFHTNVLRFTTRCLQRSQGPLSEKEQIEISSQNLLPYLRNLEPYLRRTLWAPFLGEGNKSFD